MSGAQKLKLAEIINRVPMFKGLPVQDRNQLLKIPRLIVQFPAGDKFIKYGAQDDSFYILLAGKASVQKNHIELAVVEAGDFLGEVGFICREARTATVEAITNIVAMCITHDSFVHLPIQLRDKIKDKLIAGLVTRVEQNSNEVTKLRDEVKDLEEEIEAMKGTPESDTKEDKTPDDKDDGLTELPIR